MFNVKKINKLEKHVSIKVIFLYKYEHTETWVRKSFPYSLCAYHAYNKSSMVVQGASDFLI